MTCSDSHRTQIKTWEHYTALHTTRYTPHIPGQLQSLLSHLDANFQLHSGVDDILPVVDFYFVTHPLMMASSHGKIVKLNVGGVSLMLHIIFFKSHCIVYSSSGDICNLHNHLAVRRRDFLLQSTLWET